MVETIKEYYEKVLNLLVRETPNDYQDLDLAMTSTRVAKMMKELLSSYGEEESDLVELFTTFPARGKQEMVTVSHIPFYSLCAHHMVTFFGEAHVGYIPGAKIVGLSKIPRVIDYFSHMLQTQERLTGQVADFLEQHLGARGVIVVTSARHLCMEQRGVRKPGSVTRTAAIRGIAKQATVKSEFYNLLGVTK